MAIALIVLCVLQWVSFVMAFNFEFPPGITLRTAEDWNDARDVGRWSHSVGTLEAVAGGPKNLPPGVMKCEGQVLRKEDYPELHALIGNSYSSTGDQFRLPDYRGSFATTDYHRVLSHSNVDIGKPTDESLTRYPWNEIPGWNSTPIVWVIQAK